MMRDIYKVLDRRFDPTEKDIDEFSQHFDKDNDGKITADDFKKSLMQYLVSDHYMR